MTRPLRAGLVGLGHMGRHHARVLRSLPAVELVAAVDSRPEVRAAFPDIEVLDTVPELLDRGVDMCVLATPTITHEQIAPQLAEAGVATLVEKPLAHDAKAAQAILEAFERHGTLGCVGHIERFNPALQDMRRRLAAGELGNLYQVVTRRQGPFPARITDAGVILDLATHDIDLTAWVTGATYRSVSARVAFKSGRRHEDLVALVASGKLGGATLDVFRKEPLPADHPFWRCPEIVVTPHISGLTVPGAAITQIADKIMRLERGEPVSGVVAFERGY